MVSLSELLSVSFQKKLWLHVALRGVRGQEEPDGVTVVRYIIGKLQRDHFPVVHPYLEELEDHPLLTCLLFVCLLALRTMARILCLDSLYSIVA